MNEFASRAASALGVDTDTAESATGALLKVARDQLSGEEYSKVAANVEESDRLIERAPQERESGAGARQAAQGLLGRAMEAVGAEKGGSVGIGALPGTAGLKPGQTPRFVEMFIECMRGRAGADVAESLLSKAARA
ncbi:MAG TPA: hypothetical protein DEP45_05685 [Armatimonadetes bacterium]|nr:hypothetical protein [Armatimonadota bacterium]